jgi:hypothetical protein
LINPIFFILCCKFRKIVRNNCIVLY